MSTIPVLVPAQRVLTITCKNEDEGPYELELDGVYLGSTDYDSDGSQGMRKFIKLAERMAEAFSARVVRVG